jgi:predicted DNA-binding transcriptional regulator YafY
MLEPVLYYEFRTYEGIVGKAAAFLVDEHDWLTVDHEHWLRDLAATPPGPETALRLLVAGTVVKSVALGPTPALDSALRKLEREVAADVVVALDSPECLPVVEDAYRNCRTLRCRYVNDRGDARDREIEPWFVFSNWGRWYVHGRDVAEDAAKWFRIDRMSSATLGVGTFEPLETVAVPELFNLSGEERAVRIRIDQTDLDGLPTPRNVENLDVLEAGRVEVDVTVYGQQRLEHLLVVLPPDAQIVASPEYEALRRARAGELLAIYER